jgi:tetratricopeptide (TPR) repeat protein
MTYSEKMLQALTNEDLAEAQLMLAEALQNDSEAVLAELGEELLQQGFLEESQTIYQRLLQKFGEQAAYHLPLAEIAIENDDTEEAFAQLEQIPKTDETYPESLMIQADLYQVLGIPEVSEAKLKEAQTILPEEPLLTFALGELYFANEQLGQAIVEYMRLQNKGVTEITKVSLNERIGTAYSMMGEFEQGITYLEKALAEERTDDRLFQIAFTYIQLKDNEKAIRYLQELRALSPEYQSLYLYLGKALKEEEQLEEAQVVLEEGIHENPYQVDLYLEASELAYRLQDPQKSEALLKKAISLGEKTDEALLTLSNLYVNEERFDDAIAVIGQMEEEGNPYAEWNLGHAYNELEEFEKAATHYANAYEELAHEPEFLKEYAYFLREEGQLEQATHLLEHYLAHEPGDLEAQSLLEDLLG